MLKLLFSRRLFLMSVLPVACGSGANLTRTVARLAELQHLDVARLADGAEVRVLEPGRAGLFRWNIASTAPEDEVLTIASRNSRQGRWIRDTSNGLDVRWFGASPGASAAANTRAFAEASAAINRAGGGTLRVPPGTYRVGVQTSAGAAITSAPVILIERCRRPVAILGSGAILKAADRLRFGSFDPATGARYEPRLPFTDLRYRADAPVLIHVRDCIGSLHIDGLDLDGNSSNYVLGGEWGDTGRQVGGDGLVCEGNTGGVILSNLRSHDHGRDGIMLIHAGLKADSRRYPVALSNITCDRNGRQGLSWVGGTQLTATDCRFTRTGRGRFASAPGAGLDIEAEGSVCRNGRFVNCEFSDNAGVGMVADSGDSADMIFQGCKFIGTTSWSAWPRKPGIQFRDCLFVGSIVQTYWDEDPRLAVHFLRCRFWADPALSPTGKIYGGYLADLGAGAKNVLMDNCDFRALASGVVLPWTPADIRYHNCNFRQAGGGVSYPRGVFTGKCIINSAGPVELWGSQFRGHVMLNGKALN